LIGGDPKKSLRVLNGSPSARQVLMMTLSNDPPTLIREHAKRKYSKQFKEMIDLCLNKDPAKR
jgi:hypothetical protein